MWLTNVRGLKYVTGFVFATVSMMNLTACESVSNTPNSVVETTPVIAKSHTYKLFKLKNRTAEHDSPDAIVYLPAGFDPTKDVRLLIYNHGLTHNVDETFQIWELQKGMANAPPNTVLLMPEWAADPKAYSQKAGPFHNPGFFRNMLTEVFSKVPELQNLQIDDLKEIAIATYSGGFRATMTQIYNNDLAHKVSGIMLLDSLYRGSAFDQWLKDNARELADGKKHFYNFFFDTDAESVAQYSRIKNMLSQSGASPSVVLYDSKNPELPLDADTVSKHGIVFKFTTMTHPTLIPHQNVAFMYFPVALEAWKLKEQTRTRVAATGSEPQ